MATVRQWHWISGAVCLVGMLLFSLTGITLNHAASIPGTPEVFTLEARVPGEVLQGWQPHDVDQPSLPDAIHAWLSSEHQVSIPVGEAGEWDGYEFYLPLPRPGGDAWLALEPESGELIYESTNQGWIAYFNDLHKGRDTGTAWSWFIDIFAAGSVIFCLTGLWLLARQASWRPSTWPLTALGVIVPLALLLIFVH